MKTMTYLTRNHVSDICHHYLATGSNFNECGIFFHLFGHWWKISDNWRSWLHIQKVYIHSYLALVDFGALNEHILKNIDDLEISTPHGVNVLWILDIFSLHLFYHWWQISDNRRSWLHVQNIYIHSYFTLVDSGTLMQHILTNIDDLVISKPPGANVLWILDIFSPILPLVTN